MAQAAPLADTALHGLARIGTLFLAVPIEGIREVVPHPARLAALPRTLPEMRGGLDLRGAVVPVIDIGGLVCTSAGGDVPDAAHDRRERVIMVLRTGRGVVGICVDEICGVVDLSRERQTVFELVASVTDAPCGLVAAGFACDGRTGVVLDTEGLAALPGLILAEDRLVAQTGQALGGPPVLMFAVGAHRFGLCASAIEATLPRGVVRPSPVADPVWIGRVETGGNLVPLIDTLRLLGLGQCPPARETASVVVRLAGGGCVALCIDSVIDMVRQGPDASFGMQGFSLGEDSGAGLIAGIQPGAPPILILGSEALAAHPQLANLASLAERDERSATSETRMRGSDPQGTRQPFLIFTLGDEQHAVSLDQVTEILPYDAATMIDLRHAEGPFSAMIAHRAAAIPVIGLSAEDAARTGGDAARYVMIAGTGTRRAGFLIDGLCAVERHAMRHVASGGVAAREGLPGPVIRTREGRTCAVHDLVAVIDRVHLASSGAGV